MRICAGAVHHLEESPLEHQPIGSAYLPKDESVDKNVVERGARALYEFVFRQSRRLDGKHLWLNADEVTKEGFRLRVRV